jgi:hypothetical protein
MVLTQSRKRLICTGCHREVDDGSFPGLQYDRQLVASNNGQPPRIATERVADEGFGAFVDYVHGLEGSEEHVMS